MILYIDTTNFQTMRFALIGDKVAEQNFEIAYNKSRSFKALLFIKLPFVLEITFIA